MTIHDPTMKPEGRAQVIAGLRALAQLLEDRPELPCPQHARGQHSFIEPLDTVAWERIPVSDAEKIAYVRRAGDLLGVTTEVDGRSATVRFAVGPRTEYVVHAELRGDQGEGASRG